MAKTSTITKTIITTLLFSNTHKTTAQPENRNPSNLVPGQTKITIYSGLNVANQLRGNNKKRSSEKCEGIYIPHCQNIGYNQTSIELSPLNFYDQDEAGIELSAFYDLFTSGCRGESKKTMTLLVCSLYAPTCIEVSRVWIIILDYFIFYFFFENPV